MIKRIFSDLRKIAVPVIILFIMWTTMSVVFHGFCPLVLLTGIPCPACGLTRALFSLVTLHPIQAFGYNPSYPLWIGLLIAFFLQRYVFSGNTKTLTYAALLVCIATVVIYVWRMTHSFPSEPPMVYVSENLFSHIHPEYDNFIAKLIK